MLAPMPRQEPRHNPGARPKNSQLKHALKRNVADGQEHDASGNQKAPAILRRSNLCTPQVENEVAPRAGLEPATLRLTDAGVISRWFFVGLAASENLVFPGVREEIVHGLFTPGHRGQFRMSF
jgi:hypothetical protein